MRGISQVLSLLETTSDSFPLGHEGWWMERTKVPTGVVRHHPLPLFRSLLVLYSLHPNNQYAMAIRVVSLSLSLAVLHKLRGMEWGLLQEAG